MIDDQTAKVRELSLLLDVRTRELSDIRKAFVNVSKDFVLERERLISANIKISAILSSIGDGVVATDQFGKTILVNQAMEELSSWSGAELLGKSWLDIERLEDREGNSLPLSKSPTEEAIKNSKTTITDTSSPYYFVRKDNTKFPVAITVTPIISNGLTIGSIGVYRNITHEKDIDRAKTEFVSLASHQMRTPLTIISWYSEMLQSKLNLLANKEESLLALELSIASKRLSALVNSLLNVSRLEMGSFVIEPKLLNIIDQVKNTIEVYRPLLIKGNLTLIEDFDNQLKPFLGDANLLDIVFSNLISNSIKYTPPGGKINISLKSESDLLKIVISDTGIGIPLASQEKVFTKLYRGDNAKSIDPDGTGLGLYVIREIVNNAGGKIWFESAEGRGTTFYITFPISGMVKKVGKKQLTK